MAHSLPLTFIKDDEISELLNWDEVLLAIESVLSRYSTRNSTTGGIIQPVRTSFIVPKHNSWFLAMPCYVDKEEVLCTKLLTINPKNSELGLPNHYMQIFLSSAKTGQPLAIIEGETITAQRTAAASAIATKYLVNGYPKILAIFGAGTEARSHFHALRHLYTFSEVKVWNIRTTSGIRFVEELKDLGVNATWHEKGCDAAKDADIICLTTSTKTPILEATWVKPGVHINAIGANRPAFQELDIQLMVDGVVYVDCREAALKESGDIIKSGAEIYAEIGEIICDQQKALRKKTTIFKSAGIAVEDAVIANMVYQKVVQKDREG